MAEQNKKALVALLDQQRPRVFGSLEAVKRELNPALKLKKSVQSHPMRWAAGSAGVAFLAARLLRSKKVIYNDSSKKSGFLMRTGKLIFSLSRPALTAFVIKQAQEFAEAKIGNDPHNSMLGDPPQK